MCMSDAAEKPAVPNATRLGVNRRDGWRCAYCGASASDLDPQGEWVVLTLDHVTPRCWGGSNRPTNLLTACTLCNGIKGAMDLVAWAGILSRRGIITNKRAFLARVRALLATPLTVTPPTK